ncbi:glycosyltransferase [Vibrio variabilis]|uniref:glycosyltransferase n=1 Tax=Vibrio variabilis TaxID=990271 RepID=UPI000DDB7461|nr:glycosyltransferase [Vibrio variabilis]
MNNKKITFVISTLAGGGAEGVCVNVANGLVASGWSVDLVILHTKEATYLKRLDPRIHLVVLGVDNARHAPIPLLKYVRKYQPQQMLVFNYELSVILVMLRSMFGFKTKILARNINTFSKNTNQVTGFWQRRIIRPLINHFYCKVDHVINQCQDMRTDLLSVFPQLESKSNVIYNPVANHVEAYAAANDLSQQTKQDYFLCVGRLEQQKAFHYAIEAFSKIAQRYPSLRLKIVGQGSLESDLKQLANDRKVLDRVDFEGFQSDMIPYYVHAKATLLTSLYEGFPNVLVESTTLGTPVIAFDCQSGPREIILPGINGYLVEYQSIEGLVDACDAFLAGAISSEQVRESASRYATKQIVKEYETVLGCPPFEPSVK